jgi:hypothetical protein|tara:strand:+ start:1183 stop:1812 length:630 start_codon:yes stop_codon:yes gene_type:complete
MKTIKYLKQFSFYISIFAIIIFTGCSDDEEAPAVENEMEVITDVKLIFTNEADNTDIVEASAKDSDGIGVQELEVLDAINLQIGKTYTLTFEITNALDPSDPEDVGEEILAEAAEHQFFFSFSSDAFTDPNGNGNIDGNASGTEAINYEDVDSNGNPIGLETKWTTSSNVLSGGTFIARLQHQPDVKTSTSGVTDGDTDFELQFSLNVQ